MEIFGHRGAAGLLPENTLAGFRRAAELGCHGIECDVRAVEGHLVLLHDATVGRTTGGRGRPAALGFERLRALDAGGEPIPTVAEVLPLVTSCENLVWNLEIKEVDASRLLIEEVETWPASVRSRLLLSSFVAGALAPWRGTGTARALCAERLGPGTIDAARALGCSALHLGRTGLGAAHVRTVRSAGLALRVFTVNDPAVAGGLAALGVTGVFTDRPDRLVAAAESGDC